jgi:hypothetical protein
VIVSRPLMYGNRNGWQIVKEKQVSSLDLTARGLDRLRRGPQGDDISLNANLPLRIPVLDGYTPFTSELHRKLLANPVLSTSALGAQRIWFSPVAVEVPWSEAVFDLLGKTSQRLGHPCLVISDPQKIVLQNHPVPGAMPGSATRAAIDRLPAMQSLSAVVQRYDPDALNLVVNAPAAGWLLVTDRWAAGWQAAVNGAAAKDWIGNLLFRAIPVERGASRVDFRYRPFGYPWLIFLSWGTLAMVFLAPASRGDAYSRALSVRTIDSLGDSWCDSPRDPLQ